jgi:DMSO/TMAO reductase YedYZ molybdopterin-dependent catalytic subunit
LSEVLARGGLKESVVEILFAGADRGPAQFMRSLPVEKALDPATIIAWEMNGEPIPPEFGGPLRLVVPGWYGMASVKWLERIEALEQPFSGTFQTERYVYAPGLPVTQLRVKSMFIDPSPSSVVRRGKVHVRGLAWGGRLLSRVDVAVGCTDRDWREARVVGPALPHAWRRFELIWDVKEPGRYVLRCRATDVSGESQPDSPEWNALGYGANGVHQLAVTVI